MQETVSEPSHQQKDENLEDVRNKFSLDEDEEEDDAPFLTDNQ